MYGAMLRAEFEERTGGTWPLNVGQVYTTLNRLERDGLVEKDDTDDEGRISYRITPAGRAEVRSWWSSPVDREVTPRGELVIKLALAVSVPGVDVMQVIQTQRVASIGHLQDLNKLQRDTTRRRGRERTAGGKGQGEAGQGEDGPDEALAWSLVLDNLIFTTEAELRWLDHIEGRLQRETRRRSSRARTSPRSISDRDDAGAGAVRG